MTESLDELLVRVEHWIRHDIDDTDVDELTRLVGYASADGGTRHPSALADLRDRFDGTLEFGTAGLRGTMAAGPNRMNSAVVVRTAAGLGAYLHDTLGPGAGPRVVVGYDARHRSATFARNTAAVLTAAGVEVLLLPAALPTPVLAYAVRRLDADAGVMVTASHNPAADNGYKVYLGGRVVTDEGQGAQLVSPHDERIAAHVTDVGPADEVPRADDGWTVLGREIVQEYLASLAPLRTAAPDAAANLTIVTTSLHGVGGPMLARALGDAGFTRVIPVEEQVAPNPDFPSVAFPNPEEAGAMDLALGLAIDCGADLVIANDPDADRCAVAVLDITQGTHQGVETARSSGWRMLHGDEVGILLGSEAVARSVGRPGSTVASSVVSSRALARIAADAGVDHTTTLTGFKWISRAPGLVFGYEEALGYCVDPEHVRDKDGISAAVVVASLAARLKASGRTLIDALDDVARAHGLFVTGQLSARFSDLSEIPAAVSRLRAEPPRELGGSPVRVVADLADGYEGLPPTDGVLLLAEDDTRVVVRPSGTEPKLKCYLEVVTDVGVDATALDVGTARVEARERLNSLAKEMNAALGF
ncbi:MULTISPECIES: phospho-sugar mutase [Isoptericola]|uniref:Phospho-sugar mutase n=1 Tax=Isoptericola sediminis TaxID=2733572 RepID=A0A849JX97_9MICO|nr:MULTISPECIES: phospho-sugar mutase [Isoptericola]MDO8144352.1 phospho-sugar mutase [Isoptericola sp. 178]MDO8148206.1 phospho-sugar mutase [Isoptericola sp. b515]NNU27942.1 phospho-sugar mutase [Isoptericola sediminis]